MTTLSKNIIQSDFEKTYIKLREKEKRVYTNEEVSILPAISPKHIHYKEWLLRKWSSEKLVNYLKKKNETPAILEIGCGNGWLSNRLSSIPGSRVIGTDINFLEIQQAATVFQHIPNLHFMYTYAGAGVFEEKKFDVVVFAAAIQYFESLNETIVNTLKLLKPGGEIHIIDSPFYSLTDLSAAKQRSGVYYESAGFPEMADCYFHHSYNELSPYHHSIKYDPRSFVNRVFQNTSPFPWICIKASPH